jgi:hypothetical protein
MTTMKRILTIAAALALAAVTTQAMAADPVPFPSPKVQQVFIAAQTVTTGGAAANWFTPGSTVVFRAYAVDGKSQKVLQAGDVKYFYVTIPNQPNVKLKFNDKAPGATNRLAWTGTWTVPAAYPAGLVPYRVLVQTTTKRKGQFVQMPVASSQLTISGTAPPAAVAPFTNPTVAASSKLDVSLYVDSVNGTAPAGAPVRPIGCTQTNVYKRGERVVIRTWGVDMTTADVLTTDNVKDAHFSVPGQPDVVLAYGAHGATGAKVNFWSNFWIIPADYPLGETTVHVVFNTETGKSGTYDYDLVVNP